MMTKSPNKGKSPFQMLSILPVAALVFIMTAAVNGIFIKDAHSAVTDNTSMIERQQDIIPTNPDLPPDTIIKKTIIKKVSRENPNDTVVIEKEEIITGDDVDIIRHDGGMRHTEVMEDRDEVRHAGDVRHREMRVHVDTVDMRHHGDVVIREHRMQGDTIKHVKIVKRSGNDVINEDKKVVIVEGPDHENNILYIVDGEKMTDKKAIEILNPDEIQSISVLKGEEAVKYGKNYSGVIMITTKKPKK